MATSQGVDLDLSNLSIVQLSEHVSVVKMKSIAVAHLGLTPEQVQNIEYAKRDDTVGINTEILTKWAYRTRGTNQIGTLAGILYYSSVNPEVVQGILGVSRQGAIMPAGPAIPAVPNIQPAGTAIVQPDEEQGTDVEILKEKIKDYTEDHMKIEMASWAKYSVDMEYMYTELTLEKLENRPAGPESVVIPNYKDLFTEQDQPERKRIKPKRKKVLLKADPGFGKTTFSKKVAYDWATGVFHTVSIVFCIFLKLARPGSDIENIIIEQYPDVEGLEIDEQRLKKMIQNFGSKFLIIFDGLDEVDLTQHGDVLKVIEGRKFPNCQILLTSRPHAVDNILRHFPTIVQCRGFDQKSSVEFLTHCLKDKYTPAQVLQFNSKTFAEKDNSFSSPMLMLFIIILLNGDEISVLDQDMVLGDIYFRLIRCVFRKYFERKSWEFNQDRFLDLVKNVGKVAWDMLQSGVNWYKKSEIIELVGEDIFETGLIIGNKGHQIMSKETADFIVSFPHRTIQEFFGVFYLVLATRGGDSFQELVAWERKKSIFTSNPMVLYFCIYLLKKTPEIPFELNAYEDFVEFVASRENFKVDPRDLEQDEVLDKEYLEKIRNELGVDLIGDIDSRVS